jgi:LacI family transcriptional regulator
VKETLAGASPAKVGLGAGSHWPRPLVSFACMLWVCHVEAHRAHGLEPDPDLVVHGQFTRTSGYEVTRKLLTDGRRFTGIFAATDVVASGVLHALREANLQVPADVSVVGYDDIPQAFDLVPALTTVHVPHEELGRTAVRLAVNRETEPTQHVTLGTHIVVRQSTALPPASA